VEKKNAYSIQELFDFLPIPIAELARRSGINEVTLARIRDGERTRRDTVNKLMLALSRIYEVPLSINNVTGINIMRNKRLEKKEARASLEQVEENAA
jgi:transcriptional regulator with XRE-family HTH domain